MSPIKFLLALGLVSNFSCAFKSENIGTWESEDRKQSISITRSSSGSLIAYYSFEIEKSGLNTISRFTVVRWTDKEIELMDSANKRWITPIRGDGRGDLIVFDFYGKSRVLRKISDAPVVDIFENRRH